MQLLIFQISDDNIVKLWYWNINKIHDSVILEAYRTCMSQKIL